MNLKIGDMVRWKFAEDNNVIKIEMIKDNKVYYTYIYSDYIELDFHNYITLDEFNVIKINDCPEYLKQ